MNSDDSRTVHLEPSWFGKALSLAGMLVIVGAMAWMLTSVVVLVTNWYRFEYSIFGLVWGTCARLFELPLRSGIKQSLRYGSLTTEKRRLLGEQLTILQILRWFVRVELAASAVLFIWEVLAR